jgi:hypothetical protein
MRTITQNPNLILTPDMIEAIKHGPSQLNEQNLPSLMALLTLLAAKPLKPLRLDQIMELTSLILKAVGSSA